MAVDPRTPVVVGVGQFTERIDDAGYRGMSSVDLATEAVRAALVDTGAHMAWKQSTSASFAARHATSDAADARRVLQSLEHVRVQLEELASDYAADEVIVVTITYDHAARRRSYELLADAMDLQPRGLSTTTA